MPIPKSIDKQVKIARHLIKKAYKDDPRTAIAWTGGKDSTTLLHLVKETLGEIPFPVYFNDSTMEFDEVYDFIYFLVKEWHFDLIWQKHSSVELGQFKKGSSDQQLGLSRLMKINSLKRAYKDYNFDAFMVGIRHDEHEARSEETPIAEVDGIKRYHPVLDFTENDIWTYIKHYNVPYCSLYDEGYRSLGEKPFTQPAREGKGERDGRERNKEAMMKRLRELGYW